MAALLIVSTVTAGQVAASEPISAQSSTKPTFSDPQYYTDVVPSEDHNPRQSFVVRWFDQVQSLARAGVFEGTDCAAGRFCPDDSLTRWQLAVWLMRSLGEDDLEPIRESRFADVDPDRWWAPYVERVAELGISAGCGREPQRYCPNAAVDRGHAAAAIAGAIGLPEVDSVGFTDLAGDYRHADEVDRVVEFKIMEPCSQDPLQFCRRNDVTRGQMATILFRALDWLQLNSIAESSPVPGDIFLTHYNEFSWYVKTQVVDRYGEDHPWLQAAWNATNTTQFSYFTVYGSTSVHSGARKDHLGNYRHESVVSMRTSPDTLLGTAYNETFVHELAHVYTMSNEVSSTPLALAATLLYFYVLAGGVDFCLALEILADAVSTPMFSGERPGSSYWTSSYWAHCPHLPSEPTEEAVTIARDATSGQVPEWFDEVFRDEGGDWDYDNIWESVRSMNHLRATRLVVYMLRGSFGGYCDSHQVHEFLRREATTLDPAQPWIDGGCGDAATTDAGQAVDSDQDALHVAEVRIVARKLAGGRIEFGLQQRNPDDTWANRQLPRVRFFPTTAGTNRWLASSALDLPLGDVRIVARKLTSGRIEFGLQQRNPDDTWDTRQLPRVRFFPTTAGTNRWLASSPLTLTALQPAAT